MQKFPELETLGQALPGTFSFYHLGQISPETQKDDGRFTDASQIERADRSALGIRIQGDVQALMLVLVDEGLDLSIYSEVANVLASRLATQLSAQHDIDVVISAPVALSPSRLNDLLKPGQSVLSKRYYHYHAGATIGVDAVLIRNQPLSPIGEIRA
jgi:hypothetical protein